jgi:hypothetical protein
MAGENRNGAVDLDFGDDTYRFRLGLAELEELQEKTGIGPFMLLTRLIDGEWRTQDVRETIRLGLIGGGLDPVPALKLVRSYVDARQSWLTHASLARLVVMAALSGAPEEEPGKGDAPEAETEAPISTAGALPSENSIEPPEPSASP